MPKLTFKVPKSALAKAVSKKDELIQFGDLIEKLGSSKCGQNYTKLNEIVEELGLHTFKHGVSNFVSMEHFDAIKKAWEAPREKSSSTRVHQYPNKTMVTHLKHIEMRLDNIESMLSAVMEEFDVKLGQRKTDKKRA